MIHGDLKPQNVLVFRTATGGITTKVTDFGYSALWESSTRSVHLPKSRPWNAPELDSQNNFTLSEAKKIDAYSFGMLCFWLLVGHSILDTPIDIEGRLESVSFDLPSVRGKLSLLEELKHRGKMEEVAYQLARKISSLEAEYESRLKPLFGLTITGNIKRRTSDFGELMVLFDQER